MSTSLYSRIWMLIALLTCLSLADFLLTQHFLAYAGLDGEGNGIMRYIARHFGVDAMLWVKIFWIGVLAVMVPRLNPARRKYLQYALIAVNAEMIVVVGIGIKAVSLIHG
jgi:Domain of unknown function (DUF5658)